MFQEAATQSSIAIECGDTGFGIEQVRLILASSRQLPLAVSTARSLRIFDRIIDDDTLAYLTDSENCPYRDARERCRSRMESLASYLHERLICVVINLPGVLYTIEIDPYTDKIVYWEYVDH